MTLPWWPVIWVDILGSLAVVIIASECLSLSWVWSKKAPDDAFRHYVFMLTLAIGAFSIFRSFGHLAKQALIFTDQQDIWEIIAPFSGAGNTAAFITVFAFSIYFNRLRQVKLQIDQVDLNLAVAKAEAAAALQSEKMLLTIFDGMEDAIYVIDQNFRIKYFNRIVKELLPEIELGAHCYECLMDNDAPCKNCLHQFILDQETAHTRELDILKTGKTFSLVEIPLIWIDGKKVKLNVGRNITEQKKLEAQLHHSQKMEAIGTLAGGMAHDINNSLTPVVGYSELILMQTEPDTPLYQRVQHIRDCAKRASNLISRILAFSRRQVIKKETINLNGLIDNFSKMLKGLLEENIVLELQLKDDLWPIAADSGQIEQVLANLAVNARDAMPNGGTLLIETDNIASANSLCGSCNNDISGPQVLIQVSDSGEGMNPAVKEHIFEPYFTTKSKEKGTGLGLAMSHGIIHQHGGHINLYSEPGLGTTFKIYFPAAQQTSIAVDQVKIAAPVSLGTETILVVEDDKDIRKFTQECLREYGYNVLETDCGKSALAIFSEKSARIDLMLTDVIMPDMNGKELADRIKETRPELKTLFMSGYTDNVIAHHGILDKDISFISKPFSPAALAQKVRETLDKSTAIDFSR
ncbi:MAG: response regulator [Proteobacteria bacterium]|nr:response regulator [Pseudomonadota bacterium]